MIAILRTSARRIGVESGWEMRFRQMRNRRGQRSSIIRCWLTEGYGNALPKRGTLIVQGLLLWCRLQQVRMAADSNLPNGTRGCHVFKLVSQVSFQPEKRACSNARSRDRIFTEPVHVAD